MIRALLAGIATIVALTAVASAQSGGKPVTGNPTPGTEQPAPPNVADRMTFVGCMQFATGRADASTSAKVTADGAASPDTNAPTNSRYALTKVEGSAASKVYRLEGIDSQFSPFVGAKVEITGEVKTAAGANPPTLLVEFVQRIAAKCS
jgi:hypothetical protein